MNNSNSLLLLFHKGSGKLDFTLFGYFFDVLPILNTFTYGTFIFQYFLENRLGFRFCTLVHTKDDLINCPTKV